MAAPEFAAQNLYAEIAEAAERPRSAITPALFDRYVQCAQAILDVLISFAGFITVYFLEASFATSSGVRHSPAEVSTMAACFASMVLFLHSRDGDYRKDNGLLGIRETERTIRVSSQSLLLLWVINLLLRLQYSTLLFSLCCLLIPVLLLLQRAFFFRANAWLRRRFGCKRRVLIYGGGDTGRAVMSALLGSSRSCLQPFAVLEDRSSQHSSSLSEMGYRGRAYIPVLNGILTPDLLLAYRVDLLLIASNSSSPERIAAAKDAAKLAGTSIAFLNGPTMEEHQFARRFAIDDLQFSLQADVSDGRRLYAFAKRLMDLVLSAVLLVLLSPLLFGIALLIRLDSPGPALFIQERVGLDGVLFRMFKFRSMYASAPKYELSPTSSRDWRITCIGRSLRRTGIDELPQLINVLLGEMSLVGPRPEMPFIVERYTPAQIHRLDVVPGVTGLWQLSADRAFPIDQNIQYDFYYIRNRTLSMEFAILVHTMIFAICGGI